MKIKKCVICNKDFTFVRGLKKTCSTECSKKNSYQVKKLYEKTPERIIYHNQPQVKERNKNYRKKWYYELGGKEQKIKQNLSKLKKDYEHSERRILMKKEYQKSTKCKEQKKEYRKRWNLYSTTPVVNLRKRMKRRAARNNIIENFTAEEFIKKANKMNNRCVFCNKTFNSKNRSDYLSIDHIYPVSKANEDFKSTGIKRIYTIDDVQPLCFSCNSGKRDKIIN